MWMDRMYYGTDHMIGQDDYMPYLKDKFEIRLSGKGVTAVQSVLREYSVGGGR